MDVSHWALPEHRLADEIMWEKLVLCATKEVKENTFFLSQ